MTNSKTRVHASLHARAVASKTIVVCERSSRSLLAQSIRRYCARVAEHVLRDEVCSRESCSDNSASR